MFYFYIQNVSKVTFNLSHIGMGLIMSVNEFENQTVKPGRLISYSSWTCFQDPCCINLSTYLTYNFQNKCGVTFRTWKLNFWLKSQNLQLKNLYFLFSNSNACCLKIKWNLENIAWQWFDFGVLISYFDLQLIIFLGGVFKYQFLWLDWICFLFTQF